MKATKHFDVREWADFVRDLGEDAQRSAMHEHLAAGCSRCQQIVGVLRRFAAIASREEDYKPTEETVLRAEAIFQPQPHTASGLITRDSGRVRTGRRLAGKTPARVGV